MHDWFCQIELIELIWQRKENLECVANLRYFRQATIFHTRFEHKCPKLRFNDPSNLADMSLM